MANTAQATNGVISQLPTRNYALPADREPVPARDRLPEPARSKLVGLLRLNAEARELARTIVDELMEASNATSRAKSALAGLQDAFVASQLGKTLLPKADHPSVTQKQAEVAQQERKLKEVQQVAAQRRERRQLIGAVCAGLETYVEKHIDELGVIADAKRVKVKAGENASTALARIRSEREELLRRLDAVRRAPITKDMALARVSAQIASLAARGAPSLDRLLTYDADIDWPMRTERGALTAIAGGRDAQGGAVQSDVRGTAHVSAPDALAILVWTARDGIEAKLLAEIEARYDEAKEAGLTDEQRAQQSGKLAEQVLDLERAECGLIEELNDPFALRPDTDPRAVLGLVGPSPHASQ